MAGGEAAVDRDRLLDRRSASSRRPSSDRRFDRLFSDVARSGRKASGGRRRGCGGSSPPPRRRSASSRRPRSDRRFAIDCPATSRGRAGRRRAGRRRGCGDHTASRWPAAPPRGGQSRTGGWRNCERTVRSGVELSGRAAASARLIQHLRVQHGVPPHRGGQAPSGSGRNCGASPPKGVKASGRAAASAR